MPSWQEEPTGRPAIDGLHTPGSLVHHPIAAVPLVESLLNGFLCAIRHEFSDSLAAGAPSCASPVVRMAIYYLHDRATEPIADVAAHCAISVRALLTAAVPAPVRLRRAHDELVASDPRSVTVLRVANGWGFSNAGRFATAHEAAFGEAPARTPRRVR